MTRSRRWLALLATTVLAGCLGSVAPTGTGAGSPDPGASPPPAGNGASGSKPASPPPALPPDPNGFQLTISPLLDAQGCTECHHAGRPIDLVHYPFMAGDASAAAQKLIDSLGKTMPPAPRDAPPPSLASAIAQWKSAGMKP